MRCRFFASFIFTFVLYLNDAWLRSRASFKKFACDSDEREKNNHCLSFASGYLWGLSIFNLQMNNNNTRYLNFDSMKWFGYKLIHKILLLFPSKSAIDEQLLNWMEWLRYPPKVNHLNEFSNRVHLMDCSWSYPLSYWNWSVMNHNHQTSKPDTETLMESIWN